MRELQTPSFVVLCQLGAAVPIVVLCDRYIRVGRSGRIGGVVLIPCPRCDCERRKSRLSLPLQYTLIPSVSLSGVRTMRAESISSWMNLTVCPFFKVISLGSRWVCAWIPVKVRAQMTVRSMFRFMTDYFLSIFLLFLIKMPGVLSLTRWPLIL